ncbi:Sterile alpha motif domain-containing protein 9-like [Mizuhopecten yessoensis]|uniref:Sterile alpha motif domain-containing protein 9-like n=2 Tax=Mizuhopecten yessoensis TaxID=6573 RepID=A0A210PE74_MIZYE|nr:Sterile alpha motif domain-containing protein 9-like [Mizuhopecten yessoensis]
MPYGKKKAIMIIKDELITEENDKQKSETCRDVNPEVKCVKSKVRESLRRFDTPTEVIGSYRKSAFVSTNVTRIHNLIQPIHMFIDYNDSDLQNIEARLARLTMNFASACMNDRTNGTIHFGIKALTDDGQMDGEIVGIRADKDKCNNAIKLCLREQFFEDQIEMAWKCIRSPQFIRVVESGNNPPCFVVEIDVVPHAALLEDEAVFVRETNMPDSKPTLLRLKEGTSTPEIQNDEQIRQYMKIKSRLHKQRKDEEEKPQYVQLNENLRQKFLNVFSGGDSFLTDETYNILITSPGDENLKNEIAENNLEFVQVLDPYAVFDFNSSTEPDSLYHYIEEKKGQALKVMTTDNFDKDSDENNVDSESHVHLMEDLRSSTMQTWVFANGYDRMQKDGMGTYDWKQKRSEGFKEALRYCYNDIPKGRSLAIFILLSKNYDIMLEAAEEVLARSHGEWILLAPTQDIANHWITELLHRNSVDSDVICERCIIGMPWEHVNELIRQVLAPMQSSTCQIPHSNGAYCPLKTKVRNELCDLDILSQKECDDSDILEDETKKLEQFRKVQEAFYHGEQPSWWNYWFGEDQICRRSKHDTLKRSVMEALNRQKAEEDKVAVVTLMHQPGSGGTTAARQILWDLKKEFRCCVVKKVTDQTCDQIIALRNYDESNSARPPVVLLDNCDEEGVIHLHAVLERRAREASIRSEQMIGTYCVLLICTRRTKLPMSVKEYTVLIRQELEQNELAWFQRKASVLERRFKDKEGVDPKLLISFNILKENFNFEYIKDIVKQYVDGIDSQEEKDLLMYLSLINTYDMDFQPLPISAFDALMIQNCKTNVIFGLAFSHRLQKRDRQWETKLSSELKVLLNVSSRSGQGSNLKALSIINPLFAKEIFQYLKQEASTSSTMLRFLQSRVFKRQNRSVDQVVRVVKDVLKKREALENGRRQKFSRILTEILSEEDTERAVSVLKKGFEMTEDPMIAQQIARLYIHSKNWEMATDYAIKATQLRPNNSYLWDTYGQIFKAQVFDRYESCITNEALSVEDTSHIIQVAMKGIEKFHKEQDQGEHDKKTSPNDPGYFGEVQLIILLMKVLNYSPFDRDVMHRFIVESTFEPASLSGLDDESRDTLKKLQGFTESAMRKIEERSSQLKENVTSSIFRYKKSLPDEGLAVLRENVDMLFGEGTDVVPSHLSPKESADFRRRRVKRLGGRSLSSLLRYLRQENGVCGRQLQIMFNHLTKNIESGCTEPFDTVMLVSVALALRIHNKNESVTAKVPHILELTKRMYDTECRSKNGFPYLEVFLYLVMFHWPTPDRKGKNICPVGTMRDAIKRWKLAFQTNHPRQRDEGNPHRKKETTYFFLGKDPENDEIVYYEELHNRHGGMYFKGDEIWQDPNVVHKLQRLEGTLVGDGLEVLIRIETSSGNKEALTVPTAMPIGQRSLWQKKVFFYLGFSWAGPKAFDVSSNDRQNLISKPKHSHDSLGMARKRTSPTRSLRDPTKRIEEVGRRLRKIEQLKKMKNRSDRENCQISEENALRLELNDLLSTIEDMFGGN